jgi:transposase InsO family protein
MLLIDDYTRMTWVSFLKNKSEAIDKFKVFKELVENKTDLKIKCLRSDNGGEFTSNEFEKFCEMHGIKRQFSAARTPQHNGVAERKNRTVQEMERTMLNDSKLSYMFWREEVHIVVHILNKCFLRTNHDKTPYELWKGRPTTINYLKVFGSKCYIKRSEENLGKFDSRIDEGIFLGYSSNSKAYRCYNLRLDKIVMSTNVKVDDEKSHFTNHISKEAKCRKEDEFLQEGQHEEEQQQEEESEKNNKMKKNKNTKNKKINSKQRGR